MYKQIISFDYSITSPAMTIFSTEHKTYISYGITNNKKCQSNVSKNNYQFILNQYPIWNNPQERYDRLSNIFIDALKELNVFNEYSLFLIEDYSFGSKGKVFHIAENAELLKYKIWKETNIPITEVSPKTIKKLYTGNGNSNKVDMSNHFLNENGFFIHDVLLSKIDGPANDIVDSIALNVIGQKISMGILQFNDLLSPKKKKSLLLSR